MAIVRVPRPKSDAGHLLTAEEFALRPEPVDGSREDLDRGRIVVVSRPIARHGELQIRIGGELDRFARKNRLGITRSESGFITRRDPDSVRGPDVSFVSAARPDGRAHDDAWIPGAPDLVVEILSSSDRAGMIRRKTAEYFAAGASRVWVVRPKQRTVAVHRADGTIVVRADDGVLTSDDAGFAVDGFELPVADVFDAP
ncbi:hypothetical protein AYO38_08015 [bacterium SCGC AG-212-C10]|nr:hypothetical protein AYO38_08015 [bacterium SCGC AG-212-C10]